MFFEFLCQMSTALPPAGGVLKMVSKSFAVYRWQPIKIVEDGVGNRPAGKG